MASNLLKYTTILLLTIALSFLFTVSFRNARKANTPPAPTFHKASQISAPIKMQIQWGGYYTIKTKEGYQVFRLIDINPNKLHITTFDKVFKESPAFSEVTFLVPDQDHEAMSAVEVLKYNPYLLGRRSLKPQDLEGYRQYLQAQGYTSKDQYDTVTRITSFSEEQPLITRLSEENGKLKFEEDI